MGANFNSKLKEMARRAKSEAKRQKRQQRREAKRNKPDDAKSE